MKKLLRTILLLVLVSLPVSVFRGKEASAAQYDFWNWSTWPTISQGSSGGFVSAVQSMLWASGYQTATGSVDGSFGSGTATGLRHFQNLESITADGIVGPTTWGTFDKYASKGFATRNYDHWQSSYYSVHFSDSNVVYGSLDSKDELEIAYFTLWKY